MAQLEVDSEEEKRWPIVPLTHLLSEIIDNRGKTVPTSKDGIPLIATNCIKEGGLYPTKENVRFVSKETYDKWFRGHPKPGDIIIVNKGSPGLVCQVPSPIDFCIAQDMVALRPNIKVVDPDYLLAVMRSKEFKSQVESLHVGTLIPHLKKSDFDLLKIPLPPRNIQEQIGGIYCDLSRKIEINLRMNKTLEALAHTIFNSWFIDFIPVRTKVEGKQPFGLDEETAALFPSEFEESELGEIPKGWKIGSIDDLVKIEVKRVDANPEKNHKKYIGIEDMPSKSIDLSTYRMGTDVNSSIIQFSKGDILFGSMRPYFHKVGFAPFDGITRTTTFVLRPNKNFLPYALMALSSEDAIRYCTNNMVGTTIPYVKWETLRDYKMIIPDMAIISAYNELVMPLLDLIVNNSNQSSTLSHMRDTLLPKLVSGEINVSLNNVSNLQAKSNTSTTTE
jgi:type I restriction enzyme, S subunit